MFSREPPFFYKKTGDLLALEGKRVSGVLPTAADRVVEKPPRVSWEKKVLRSGPPSKISSGPPFVENDPLLYSHRRFVDNLCVGGGAEIPPVFVEKKLW